MLSLAEPTCPSIRLCGAGSERGRSFGSETATHYSLRSSTPSRWATTSVPLTHELSGDRGRSAHDDDQTGEGDGEVFDLLALTSENEEECSGGETRTHNLAVNSRLLCH